MTVRLIPVLSGRIAHDARHSWRSLKRQPSVAAAAVAMLALSVGLTAAMFTLADALLLRPVPFADPDHLATVVMQGDRGGPMAVSPAVLRVWKESGAFAAVEGAVADTALIEAAGSVAARRMARITPGLFEMLGGVRPIHGRLFTAADVHAGLTDRVLLSEDLWRTLFHADPGLVGRAVSIDGEKLVVLGILPSEFRFPSWDSVIWRAVDFEARSSAAVRPIAHVRFAPDVPRPAALRIATRVAHAVDATTANRTARVRPLAGLVPDPYYQRAVPLLIGGVILVFLVLCANTSSLLLARLTARQRDFTVRSALGASRGRLIAQSFAESAMLGALGVVAGAGLAWALVALSRAFLPDAFLLRTLNPLNLDLRALAVASIAGVTATFGAGLVPALVGSRADCRHSLQMTPAGGTETRGARVVARMLLSGEMALACTLLICAVLLVRSFVNLAGGERGLDVTGAVVTWMSLPPDAFPDQAARESATAVIEGQVRSLPGVTQLAWSFGLPPDGGTLSFGDWRPDTASASPVDMVVDGYEVGPDFFALYGIPLLKGRTFLESDPEGAIVIGERFARALWPGADPIGQRVTFDGRALHVVGLVGEIHHPSLDATLNRPELYERFTQVRDQAMLSVRCQPTCPGAALVRQRIGASHPGVRVIEAQVLEDVYGEQLAPPRAAAALAVAFAAVAVLAAAGGLFSVLSYAVARRRREFGIRTALGASPREIQQLVLRDGVAVACIGIAIGTAVAWLFGSALTSLFYGVTLADPLTWTSVLGILAITTLAASWRPSRRAVRTDCAVLLREE